MNVVGWLLTVVGVALLLLGAAFAVLHHLFDVSPIVAEVEHTGVLLLPGLILVCVGVAILRRRSAGIST